MSIDTITKINPNDIFDPSPSYYGKWVFSVENLFKNSKVDSQKILFSDFYQETYVKPMLDFFGTSGVLNFNVSMESTHNDNLIGRTLRYNRASFLTELVGFLDWNIDNYGKSPEEKDKYIKDFIKKYIDLPEYEENKKNYIGDSNIAFSEALKVKAERLKDVIDKEISSDYYEAALNDYSEHRSNQTFKEFINYYYKLACNLQVGILKLGNFFDRNLDFNDLVDCFEPYTLYLLFAKFILEYIENSEKKGRFTPTGYQYLLRYREALVEITKKDKNYRPYIIYTIISGKKIRYGNIDFFNEFAILLERHPELRKIKVLEIDRDSEIYKDISLMQKIQNIYSGSVELNWEFLPKDEKIKTKQDFSKISININKRIEFLEKTSYLGTPLKGLKIFNGYYVFIYGNSMVLLEKFWKNEETMEPEINGVTYIMTIDNFIEMSKIPNINLKEYIKTIKENSIKRIFHTCFENWAENVSKEINGPKYRLDNAIDFIAKLQVGDKNE